MRGDRVDEDVQEIWLSIWRAVDARCASQRYRYNVTSQYAMPRAPRVTASHCHAARMSRMNRYRDGEAMSVTQRFAFRAMLMMPPPICATLAKPAATLAAVVCTDDIDAPV